MNNIIRKFNQKLLSIPRYSKITLVIILDVILCLVSTILAFNLKNESLIIYDDTYVYSVIISIIIALPIFWIFGMYRIIFRFTDLSIILNVFKATIIYGILYFLIISLINILNVPKSIGILQPMIFFFGVIASRLIIKILFNSNNIFLKSSVKKNVLVYGAGAAGRQLVTALENSLEFDVLGFLDDNDLLVGKILLGQKIYSPNQLIFLIKNQNINMVFLALPSISRIERNQIINNLNKYHLIVKTLPSISELVDSKITISDIKDLYINDLLNREEVKPNYELLNRNIKSKVILITGAGGSIGSELCRQIIKLKPKKLLLAEINEFALYKIYNELSLFKKDIVIIPLLLNVQNQKKLESILDTFKVETLYHAAAYKHVPLVEENICEGVENNVLSTLSVANAAVLKKISDLVLISSDKAVRPTNIMGASKRLSELCLQGIYNNNRNIKTNFSIVRFGNVLESSGSVIPKFKKQIHEGGPITLTHKDITRYFMTITEAAQLVIQAGALGKNSEVFVLDMGESIKIIDLVEKMVSLSGLSIKDSQNPYGDIEIEITGLRPGEKLYEELLIGDNPQTTTHAKIKKIEEPYIPFDKLEVYINELKSLIHENNALNVKKYLLRVIESFNSNQDIVDHLFVEKSLKINEPDFKNDR